MQRSIALLFTVLVLFSLTGLIVCKEIKGAAIATFSWSDAQNLVEISPRQHVIKKEETLLDVARFYDLGINEIQALYPDWDPWMPPPGIAMDIPSQWILPEILKEGILVNTAELRLYYFNEKKGIVKTFPISIGERDWATPQGTFKITEKVVEPAWTVPPSLRTKYEVWTFPPGPDNPLGGYWLGLGDSGYGIHGTDFAWSIGRLVTRGCIRMYPEDIRLLFDLVGVGTPVKIVYEPVKIGNRSGRIFVEIHEDVYGKISNFSKYAYFQLFERGMVDNVDLKKLRQALYHRTGLPVDITRSSPAKFYSDLSHSDFNPDK